MRVKRSSNRVTSDSRRPLRRLRAAFSAALAMLMVTFGLALVTPPANAAGTTFSSTWDTTKTSTGSSGSNQIKLPLIASGNYNFVVDWGDGSSNTITSWNQAEVTHTYATGGVKNLSIAGTIKGWQFANSGDRLKLTDISAWGPLQLGNDGAYFWGAANLNLTATDGPDLSATNNLSNIFLNATSLNADLSGWDVSAVNTMTGAFRGASAFNGDVTGWDVGAVTTMNGMFRGASAFNQDISGWDVSSVTNLTSMFNGATAFDQNLGSWDVTSVLDMPSMFASAGVSRANYDALLIGWSAQDVEQDVEFDAGDSKYTSGPASTAHAVLTDDFNWTITDGGITSAPDAPTVVNTTRADQGASATWNEASDNNSPVLEYVATIDPAPSTGSATCSVVPPAARSCSWTNLTNGQTYSVTVTARNAVGTSPASTPVTVVPEVDVPNSPVVDEFSALALDSKARVTWDAPSGGGTPVSYTATSSPGGKTCVVDAPAVTCEVLGLTNGTDYTFTVTATNPGGTSTPSAASNSVTPGPVFETVWDTTKTSVGGSGSQQIRLPLVADGTYDFVVDWGDGSFSNIVTGDVSPSNLSGVTHSYSSGGVKRLTITGTVNGWNFQHGVAGDKERLKLQEVVSWGSLRLGTATAQGDYFKGTTNMVVSATDELDLTGTTSLAGAFQDAVAFNGAIGNWDVSAVTDMNHMFAGAAAFNQPLDSWTPTNVTSMANMFANATAFNQSLTGWGDIGNVTTTASMFQGATAFNGGVAWSNLTDLTTTESMFDGADAFNQDLGWPASQPALVTTASMFSDANSFNGSVSTLDMSGVTNATAMFSGAAAFNQPVAGWTLGSGVDVSDMFLNATSFNQDISGLNFEGVTRFGQFLHNSGLANLNEASGVYNYNLFLRALAAQNVLPDNGPGSTVADRTIDSSPAKYSAGLPTTARQTLVGRGFVITDGGATNQDVPDAPEDVQSMTADNPPTIIWTAPDDNNSPITNYTVTATHKTDPDTYPTMYCETVELSCMFDEALPDSLNSYLISVTATNAIGTSAPSVTSAPDTPAQPIAVAGDASATISITPPVTGAAPTSYTVTSTLEPFESCTITVPEESCVITGLTNDQSYTFTAVASNWLGSSDPSAPTSAVVPGKVLATTWRTNNTSAGSSAANQIKLPLASGGTYDFYVAWGDGTTDHITSYNQPEVTHTYALAGTKNVTITGTVNGWRFNNTGDRLKMLSISTWGPLQLGNAGGYFYGASNLAVTATDELNLTGTTSLFNAFLDASTFNANVTGWDVSQVTDMTNAFKGTTAFTGTGLSVWNVGSAAQLDSMFENSGMNGDVGGWETGSALDMNRMFAGATNFNQDIGDWDTADVEDMTAMFSGASSFNQSLSNWNTGAVASMASMFEGSAIDASRSFANWNIANVTNFTNMFQNNPGLAMPDAVAWYNGLLIGWESQITTDGARTLTVCGAVAASESACADGAPQYSAGAAENARLDLIDRGWTVIDGGLSDLNVPDQIVNVVANSDVGSSIISWDEPADNGSPISHYTVSAVDRNDHAVVMQCATVSAPELATTCPYSTDDFVFSVTATNGVGTSIPSSVDVPGINAPIVQPAGSGALRITIDPATTGGTPQNFYIADSNGGPWVCQFSMPTQSCVVTGLTDGVDYQYVAIATNEIGESGVSAPSAAVAPTGDAFTSTWVTTNTSAGSSNSTSVRLPLDESGSYNFVVQWGDGASSVVTSDNDPDATHVYEQRGTYNVSITGEIDGWAFNGSGDRLKLTEISNWGPLGLGNSGGAFKGAANFRLTATEPLDLTGVTNLAETFSGASAFNGDVTGWNVSAVTDMSDMFNGSAFVGDVSVWDTASVTSMSGMFANTGFNGDLSGWVTSSLTDASNMFNTSAFNGDISGWDVTGLTNASGMFQNIAPMVGPSYINWYNRLLTSWAAQDIPVRDEASVPFTACGSVDSSVSCAGGLQYYGDAATTARATLVAKGWDIVDGGAADANVPDAPSGINVVRDGSQATVTWTAPSDNGSAITSYQVTTDPGAITCDTATTECVVTGLNPDESVKYSYTVTATNELGTSPASDPYPALRPGSPGTPVAVAGNAAVTVTVPAATTGGPATAYIVTANPGGKTCTISELAEPLSCQVNDLDNGTAYTFTAVADNAGGTSDPSAVSNSATPLAPARNPEFATPTPTADGYTVQIVNYDANFGWGGIATNGGVVVVSGSGLVTVSGVAPDTISVVTVNTTRFGYQAGTAETAAVSLKAGLVPTFNLPVTRTADGFTVQISNYSADYGWGGSSSPSASVSISGTGLVSVTNAGPDVALSVIISTSRTGYAAAGAEVTGTSLRAALTPTFGTPTPTANGFTVPVTNYSSSDGFNWQIGLVTPDGADVSLDSNTGLLSVTFVSPNTASSVEVFTTRDGYAPGTATVSSKSLNEARTPTFGDVAPTADGFTVPITNYGDGGDGFTWDVTSVSPGSGSGSIDAQTGILTVTGLDPSASATALVTTTRNDYVSGSASVEGSALAVAGTPILGSVTRTADGFTVPITNYYTDDNNVNYIWSVDDLTSPAVAELVTSGDPAYVRVTGLEPGASATVTVRTTREGSASGVATKDGQALEAARTPTFGEPTATADGYTVQITNYGTSGDGFTWSVAQVDPGTASATIAADTGLLTVTGVEPGASALVTVTTTRDGYVDGTADVSADALFAALDPEFDELTSTVDGYTVQITNYSTDFTWQASATNTSDTPTISETGLVTVTGVDPGTTSELTVTNSRDGWVDGTGVTSGSSDEGPVRNPAFGTPTRTADGFTVAITNYGTDGDGYIWTSSLNPATGSASIDNSGLVTVSGFDQGVDISLTVDTTRTGYTSGTNSVDSRSLDPKLTPALGTPVPTQTGFTVEITNYDASFVWAATATSTEEAVTIEAVTDTTALVTVTGVEYATESTVTVTTNKTLHAEGSATATATSLNGDAYVPTFDTPTPTADGFTVQITNYLADYNWSASADLGTAEISDTGLLTVFGLDYNTTAVVVVDTSRDGYDPGDATIDGTSLMAPTTPTFGTPTPTADGFTVEILNYADPEEIAWSASATADGTASIGEDGVLTVTGLNPGTESTATVTTTQAGHVAGSATVTASSITGAARNPSFGVATSINGGFTVQITNYDAVNYTWNGSATNSGSVAISDSGLVTVSGLGDGVDSMLTVVTTRTGYFDGTNAIGGQALEAAKNPTFGTPTRTADGFTVQITNYDNTFEWSASATNTSNAVTVSGAGLVTVTGVEPSTASTVTVSTTKALHNPGSGQIAATSLASALNPTFDTPERTADGFTVSVTNFAADDGFTWAISGTSAGTAEINQTSGLVTVTGVAPGAPATVVVSATQTGYVDGAGSITGSALQAALTPTFGTPSPTADGYKVQITNYSANYGWSGTATATSDDVRISDSGLITVTGVAPDTESVTTVQTVRAGYVSGSATVTASSLKAALVPEFTEPISAADGFQVTVTNYDPAYGWDVAATNTSYPVEINDSGVIVVTGVAPGIVSDVTVSTSRAGYADGEAEVSGSAEEGAALTPIFGSVTSTAVGFDVQIINYRSGFTWNVSGASGTVNSVGYLSITGLAPSQSATVTVSASRAGFATGSATVSGQANPAASAAPQPTRPQVPTITAAKVKQKKNNKSSVTLTFVAGADGGAPILGSRAACKPKGSKSVLRVSGSSLSSLTVKKLKNKTKYTCTVEVYNALGASAPSAGKSFKVKG